MPEKKDKPTTIKAKVRLVMTHWQEPNEAPPLEMTGQENGLHTGFVLDGVVELEKDEMYDILRAESQDGKKPLFVLEIL